MCLTRDECWLRVRPTCLPNDRAENPRIRLIGVNVGVYLEYSNVNSGWFSHDVVLRIKPFNR